MLEWLRDVLGYVLWLLSALFHVGAWVVPLVVVYHDLSWWWFAAIPALFLLVALLQDATETRLKKHAGQPLKHLN